MPIFPESRDKFFYKVIDAAFSFVRAADGSVDQIVLHQFGRKFAGKKVATNKVIEHDTEFDTGSGIEVTAVSALQARNLDLLGRVWGFLKYHHPSVTSGHTHWDYELFRGIPTVLTAKSESEGQHAVLAWASRLESPPECDPCALRPTGAHIEPDLEWLENEGYLGADLQAYLQEVYQQFIPVKNRTPK